MPKGTRIENVLDIIFVYINSLLKALSNHCYAISIISVSLPSPSFADDISLLALYPSFLEAFMNICHKYGLKWRYEFNHTKSGVRDIW